MLLYSYVYILEAALKRGSAYLKTLRFEIVICAISICIPMRIDEALCRI